MQHVSLIDGQMQWKSYYWQYRCFITKTRDHIHNLKQVVTKDKFHFHPSWLKIDKFLLFPTSQSFHEPQQSNFLRSIRNDEKPMRKLFCYIQIEEKVNDSFSCVWYIVLECQNEDHTRGSYIHCHASHSYESWERQQYNTLSHTDHM